MEGCIKIKTDISKQHKQKGHVEKGPQIQRQKKEENSTFVGNKQSMNASQYTRVTFTYSSHPQPLVMPAYSTTVQTVINPQTQIIYYPVIHNKLVPVSPAKSRTVSSTVNSSKVQKRKSSALLSTPIRNAEFSIETKDVLTPEQFRRLSSHNKK